MVKIFAVIGVCSVFASANLLPLDYATTVIDSGSSYEVVVENDDNSGFRIVKKGEESFGTPESVIAEELYEESHSDEFVPLRQYGNLDLMQQISANGNTEFVVGVRREKVDDGYSKILFFKKRREAEACFAKLRKSQKTAFTGLPFSEIYESRRMELHFRMLRFLEDQRAKGACVVPITPEEIDKNLKKYGDTTDFVLKTFYYASQKKVNMNQSLPKKKKKHIKKKKKSSVKKEVKLKMID
jgi:hypothetical protein